MKPRVLTADDLIVCDCAGCGKELLSPRQWRDVAEGLAVTDVLLPERVAARVAGRPYCRACLGE